MIYCRLDLKIVDKEEKVRGDSGEERIFMPGVCLAENSLRLVPDISECRQVEQSAIQDRIPSELGDISA